MGQHLKKHHNTSEVIKVFQRYLSREIGITEVTGLLKIKRRQFFNLLKSYREQGQAFQFAKPRCHIPRQITLEADQKILEELKEEKRLIDDPNNPIRFYNYSYVKTRLKEKHAMKVSLPSIITRAKKTVITNLVFTKHLMTVKLSPTMSVN